MHPLRYARAGSIYEDGSNRVYALVNKNEGICEIGAWFINQILLQLFLVLGPIFVLCLLFDFSYGWFHRWVGELAHQVAVTLGLDMLASLLLKVIQNAF